MIKYILILLITIISFQCKANKDVKQVLIEEMTNKFIDDNSFDLDLKHDEITINLDKGNDYPFYEFNDIQSIDLVNLDKIKKTFKCKIILKSEKTYIVDGSYLIFTNIPVVKNIISRNEIIEERDIDYIKLEANRIRKSIIKDEYDIINKSPKNSLRPYTPINNNEIIEPNIVKKGDIVNINYTNHNLNIKMSAIAMEDGAKNTAIKVKNIKNNNIISVVVKDSNNVKLIN